MDSGTTSATEKISLDVAEETQVEVTHESILSPNSYALTILMAMNRLGKHIYEGTVSDKVRATRRKAGRVAKKSRKINR